MKISKMSNMFNAPEWLNLENTKKEVLASNESKQEIPEVPMEKEYLSEELLMDECDKIEQCASANEKYCYSSSWDESSVSHLTEYAMACGMSKDNVVAVTQQQEAQKPIFETSPEVEKIVTASANAEANTKKIATLDIGDAFRLDEKIANAERKEADWEVNRPQSRLAETPAMIGDVIPVRGGERTDIQNNPKLPSNQNSISDANKIENLANSAKEDTGTRLANEQKAKIQQRVEDNKAWEQEKIDDMPMRHTIAHGNVFPTEALSAQSGLGQSKQPGIASFDPDTIPDRTAGEQLKEASDARRASIKQEFKQDDWQGVRGHSKMRSISEDFGDQLKKALRK